MPVVPSVSSFRDMPPVPQNQLPLFFAPFFAILGVLGLVVVSWGLPSILLLFPSGECAALALLRAYWIGRTVFSALALLSPVLFLGLTGLLYWLTARKLDPEIREHIHLAPFFLIPILLPLIGILMWSALPPGGTCAFCDEIAADIRQIEAGELEEMTVLLDERSVPESISGVSSDELTLHRRSAARLDGNFGWVTLRFPDGLDFTPVPDSFVVIGQTYDWNREHVQRYEITYTTNFRLVVSAAPAGGPL